MADKYMQWIETSAGQQPHLAEQLSELGELYHKKLWHQLTLRLEAALEEPAFAADRFLVDLYQNFITGFAHRINLLKLAFFAVAASKQLLAPAEGQAFLQDVISGLEATSPPDAADPLLYLRMQIAQYQLAQGATADAKRLLQAGEAELDARDDVDAQVAAAVHLVAMQLHKQAQDYAEFYRSALLYLAHVPVDTLPAEFALSLAVDVSLAALLGEDIYNFGELMLHPIVPTLTGTPHAWLGEMLDCFHAGDIHRYDQLCTNHAGVLNAQPALVAHERRLREKITVLSLLQLIEGLPAEKRRIPLDVIAERTKLPLDGVEFLLMKAMSLHLIEGIIDQVEGTVAVSWLVPRVLTLPQVQAVKVRLEEWLAKVQIAAMQLEQEAAGVVEIA
jgi:26S proteasome regulatory subunit N9